MKIKKIMFRMDAATRRMCCSRKSGVLDHSCQLGAILLLLTGWCGAVPVRAAPESAPAVAPAEPAMDAPAGTGGADWEFATRLSTVFTYDDNIFILPSRAKGDYYAQLAPTFAAGVGNFRDELAPFASIPHFLAQTGEEDLPRKDFAYASYTPDGILFAKYTKQDAVNHDVKLAARQETPLWNVQGKLQFQQQTDANIDTGSRLRETYYTGDLHGEYALTGKVSGGAELYGNRSEYSGGFASTDGRATGFLDYQIAGKTSLGLGGAAGYLAMNRGANQTYEQPLVQLKYQATEKVYLIGQAGEEFRQYASKIGNRTQGVFNVSGSYDPADSTRLSVSSRRDTVGSAEYAGENIVSSVYQGSVRQRFLQKIYLTLTGGFVHNIYVSNEVNTAVVRRDDYDFGKVSVSRDVTRNGTVEMAYEHRKNASSVASFGFDENLYSLAASFIF